MTVIQVDKYLDDTVVEWFPGICWVRNLVLEFDVISYCYF